MNKPEFIAALEALMPKEELMHPAWVGCLSWAIGDAEIMARFRAETGNNWTPGATPIERMVDEACGMDGEFIVAFAKWMNANIWGDA